MSLKTVLQEQIAIHIVYSLYFILVNLVKVSPAWSMLSVTLDE